MSKALALADTDEAQARRNRLLASVTAGVPLEKAMVECGVLRAELETAVLNPTEAARWADAQIAAIRRTRSVLNLQDIFSRVAAGTDLDEAVTTVMGEPDPAIYQLIAQAPDVNAMYTKAMEAWAIAEGAQILKIVDDTSRDTLPGPKGGEIPNIAAVTRAKTRAEFRWKLMGAHNPLYAEKKANVAVEVNLNHGVVLEEARRRARLREKHVTPAQMARAVDAVFSEAPPESPTPAVEPGAAADHMRAAAVAEYSAPKPARSAEDQETKDSFGFDD